MNHSNWQNFRALQSQGQFYAFNIRKRSYVRIDDIGFQILTYFERYKNLDAVLQCLAQDYEDFDPLSDKEDIINFFTQLCEYQSSLKSFERDVYCRLFGDFSTLSWVISSKCNLKCKHCRQSPLKELSFEKKLKLIDYVAQSTLINKITFSGGEPTIHPELWDLVKYTKEWGFAVSLVTNGTHLTDEVLEHFQKYEIVPAISLDGVEKYHNLIRGKNVFKKTLEGLNRLESWQIPFRINRVIIPGYEGDENEYIQLLDSFRYLKTIHVYRCIPSGEARQNIHFSKHTHYKILEDLLIAYCSSSLQERSYIFIDDPLTNLYIPLKILQKRNVRFGCLTKTGTLSIQPDGSFLACQALPSVIAVWNTGLNWNEIKEHPLLNRLRTNKRDPKLFPAECISCSEFSSCHSGCGAFTFPMKKVDPLMLSKVKDPFCPYCGIKTDLER